jgi:hypothetical protein
MSGRVSKILRKFGKNMDYNDSQYRQWKSLYKMLNHNKRRELLKEMRQFNNEQAQTIKHE